MHDTWRRAQRTGLVLIALLSAAGPAAAQVYRVAALNTEQIRTLDDLQRLPLLSKQEVRENLYFDLMSDSHRKRDVYRITTSGSTGQPLVAWADRHQLEFRWAATLRSQEWTGYRFGDRCAAFYLPLEGEAVGRGALRRRHLY